MNDITTVTEYQGHPVQLPNDLWTDKVIPSLGSDTMLGALA